MYIFDIPAYIMDDPQEWKGAHFTSRNTVYETSEGFYYQKTLFEGRGGRKGSDPYKYFKKTDLEKIDNFNPKDFDLQGESYSYNMYVDPKIDNIKEKITEANNLRDKYSVDQKNKKEEIEKTFEKPDFKEYLKTSTVLSKEDVKFDKENNVYKPTKKFWDKWAVNKEEIKKAGVFPKKEASWLINFDPQKEEKFNEVKKNKETFDSWVEKNYKIEDKLPIAKDLSVINSEVTEVSKTAKKYPLKAKSLLNKFIYQVLEVKNVEKVGYWGGTESPKKTASLDHRLRVGTPVIDYVDYIGDSTPGERPNCRCTVYFKGGK